MGNSIYMLSGHTEWKGKRLVSFAMVFSYEGKYAIIEYGYNGKVFDFYVSSTQYKNFVIDQKNIHFYKNYINKHLQKELEEVRGFLIDEWEWKHEK